MKLVADLHIHSHFSRATSKDLTFEHLHKWAQIKGVQVVATGDIAHPGWLQEMHAKLEPAEDGLFRLKEELSPAIQEQIPAACRNPVRFLLGGEISNIYKRGGKTRKIHNIVFAPSLDAVERLQTRLERIGNIRADGRPILGLDSRDLLEIVLEVDDRCHLIPAHIWTPWFAMLGSMSGFDSVEECFADLTPHIFALETGLSSDPPMNWRISNLDRYTLVSNSDAHSPQKLAREATLFDTELTYDALFAALRTGDPEHFLGTVEFFPEEGKYHLDGHRKCGVCWEPATTLAHHGICPQCGKAVTVGVMHRVEVLADRLPGEKPARTHPYYSLVPLPEILSEVHGVGASSRAVEQEYHKLLRRLGSELYILRAAPLQEIAAGGGIRLAEGIGRMRMGQVDMAPGYDGEYGVVHVLGGATPQIDLFTGLISSTQTAVRPRSGVENPQPGAGDDTAPDRTTAPHAPQPGLALGVANAWEQQAMFQLVAAQDARPVKGLLAGLNQEQIAAVQCVDAPLSITAGPGTGKTRVLTVRIAYLVGDLGVNPEAILAITFTNKAAREMATRLDDLAGAAAAQITVQTFHAFGATLLRRWGDRLGLSANFAILNEDERMWLLRQTLTELGEKEIDHYARAISAAKSQLLGPDDAALAVSAQTPALAVVFARYEAALRASQAVDFDDLVALPVQLLEQQQDVLAALHARYRWLSVDEYQDVNLAQVRLLSLLAAGGANLCVIGDPDQAIYGFRGADYRYFQRFHDDYPNAMRYQLTQNYRSAQRILDAAMQVIGHNPDRTALRIWSEFVEEVKLDVRAAATDKAEAEQVVHQIEQMVGGTSYFSLDSGRVDGAGRGPIRSFADFAVLYRLGAQAGLFAEALDRSGIPYQTVGQSLFYGRKAIHSALALLWLQINPRSVVHLSILLAAKRNDFSGAALQNLQHQLRAAETPLPQTLRAAAATGGFTTAQRRRLLECAQALETLHQTATNATPAVAQMAASAYQLGAELRGVTVAPEDELLQELISRTIPYGSRLLDFLAFAALQSEADGYDPRADRVTVMSLHAAKGLEFPVVFIVGCEEGLLPYQRAGEQDQNEDPVAEERRLFYVGLTRARERILLSHARRRFLFGRHMENPSSRFLDEIEEALKQVPPHEPLRPQPRRPAGEQMTLF